MFKETTYIISRALDLVPRDSREAVPLLSQYTRALSAKGDFAGAQQALNQQITIAQREGDSALEMRALWSAGRLSVEQFYYREALENVLSAIELAVLTDDPRAESEMRQGGVFASLGIGDIEGARGHATAMLGLAERLGDRNRWATSHFVNLLVSCAEGDWRAAREASDRGLTAEPEDPRLIGVRAIVEYEVGEFGQGANYLERLLEVMHRVTPGGSWEYIYPAWVIPLVSRITGVADRFDIAKEVAESLISLEPNNLTLVAMARTGLALIAVQSADDSMTASEQYKALKPLQGIMLRHVPISIDRLLGLLSQTVGKTDRATAHLEDALAFCRKAGYHIRPAT